MTISFVSDLPTETVSLSAIKLFWHPGRGEGIEILSDTGRGEEYFSLLIVKKYHNSTKMGTSENFISHNFKK
jgi:hypothetical protein